uniref:RNA 3'-terminal phosphate cyclase n=1 Tax=Timema poppense TaxID=170557 RepID=A0A7R9GUL1_TIMPO|nr:unnamed protein product [Timema poppensis]
MSLSARTFPGAGLNRRFVAGGQILRMALAFSALRKIPIRVHNIRAGRSNPGLRAQHLKGVKIVCDMSQGKLKGADIGSTEIHFYPGKIISGEYEADTQTAGSICLLLQVALPCALFSDGMTILKLKGGTNAEMAPQFDYTTEVTIRHKHFNYFLRVLGYFPRGGGEVHIRVKPVKQLNPINIVDAGQVVRVWGWAFVAGNLPIKVANTMADSATQALLKALPNIEVSIEAYKERTEEAIGTGSGINIVAETSTGCLLGGSALGKRELKTEEVGVKAVEDLLQSVKTEACVDSYAQDQLILLMALANGKSRVKCGSITLHTETAIHIAQLLTQAKFNIVKEGANSVIECEGIGLSNG